LDGRIKISPNVQAKPREAASFGCLRPVNKIPNRVWGRISKVFIWAPSQCNTYSGNEY